MNREPQSSFSFPSPTPTQFPHPESPEPALSSGSAYIRATFSKRRLRDDKNKDIEFDTCLLSHVDASSSRWTKFRFSDVIFDTCDLANAKWDACVAWRIKMISSRLTGLNLAEARFSSSVFSKCKANLANFQGASLKGCTFEECDLSGADFHRADLREAIFLNCDLRGARLFEANLKAADLRGSALSDISATIDDLKGTIVSPPQVIDLAPLFGLTIQPEK